MKFTITDYTSNGSFCNIHIEWIGPLEFKCYIHKNKVGETIKYLIENEEAIQKYLLNIQDMLQNVPSPKPEN